MSNKKKTFEQKALNNINTPINEGLLFRILKFIMKSKAKRVLRKMGRDPEHKATIADLNYNLEKLKKSVEDYEKEFGEKPYGGPFLRR